MQEREICALKTLAEAEALAEMAKNQLYKDVFYPSTINVKENANGEDVEFRLDFAAMFYCYTVMNLMGEEPKNKGGMYEMNAKENAQ